MAFDWTDYYVATAGASAALLGLLFVAIQIHLDVIAADPERRWLAIARSTFYNFVALFALSLLMLFPTSDSQVRGAMLMVVAVFGSFRLLTAWLPVWRGIWSGRRENIVEVLWMLASPLAAYLFLGTSARQVMDAGATNGVLQNIALFVLILFLIVLRNSWRLLVEAPSGQKNP